MNKTEASSLQLEILVSTVNRNSLDFLQEMFQNNSISDYQILIINQTSEDNLLHSDEPNISVINSFEIGLSKSRNLAMENAIGDICLLADDDVIYLKDFEKTILESYRGHNNADVITFKTLTTENKPYSKYPNQIEKLGAFSKYILSIEISFRRLSIVNNNIHFNENFGLGATFEDSENYVFFKDLFANKNLNLLFVPEYIVMHKPFSSSNDIASDRMVFARSALNYRLYGNAAYAYVAKLIFFLVRKKMISIDKIKHKFKVAHSGIKAYKNLNKL